MMLSLAALHEQSFTLVQAMSAKRSMATLAMHFDQGWRGTPGS